MRHKTSTVYDVGHLDYQRTEFAFCRRHGAFVVQGHTWSQQVRFGGLRTAAHVNRWFQLPRPYTYQRDEDGAILRKLNCLRPMNTN